LYAFDNTTTTLPHLILLITFLLENVEKIKVLKTTVTYLLIKIKMILNPENNYYQCHEFGIFCHLPVTDLEM